jgi:lysophospholipase L1-like esterase
MRTLTIAAAIAAASFFVPPALALADQPQVPCKGSIDQVKLAQPLSRVSHRLAVGEPITIVAIGSSSTAGAGASSSAASYPSRLEVELSNRFPRAHIKVINRGVNGEEAADMLARFESGVLPEKPDLVLWQLGTNSVLRDRPMAAYDELVRKGVRKLKAIGSDIVLIDPQYAPKVIEKPDAEKMVGLIGAMAKRESVELFKRFVLMRSWYHDDKIPFDTFVSSDGIHMNDWSYACFAKTLSAALAEAATRPVTTVSASPTVR